MGKHNTPPPSGEKPSTGQAGEYKPRHSATTDSDAPRSGSTGGSRDSLLRIPRWLKGE